MKTPTPAGFYVCGLCSACLALAMLPMVLDPGSTRGERVSAMVLAALSAVATEALWRARPWAWAWRASCSLALVYASALLAWLVALRGTGEAGPLVGMLVFSAFPLVPMLGYIHTRSGRLWPRARVAVSGGRP